MRHLSTERIRPSWPALQSLVRAGRFFFIETLVRNALYLWQVHTIVGLGAVWATAFGVFNTIRVGRLQSLRVAWLNVIQWGLIMVPIQTLEATSLVFVGHRYGEWTTRKGQSASRRDLFGMLPALCLC